MPKNTPLTTAQHAVTISQLADAWYGLALSDEDAARIAAMTVPAREKSEAAIARLGNLNAEPADFSGAQCAPSPRS